MRHLALVCLLAALSCDGNEGKPAPGSPSAPSLAPTTATAKPTPLAEVHVAADDVFEVQGSTMRLNPHDQIVSKVIARDKIWEPLETTLFTDNLSPGDVVVDVGANIGYYTLLAARLVGDSGHVYAFEPEPEALALLRSNVALNGYTNVTVVGKALGREVGTLSLYLAKNNRGDHRMYDPTGKREPIEVDVVTLDGALAEAGATRVDLIKIDTQGAECMILEGASQTVATQRGVAIIMEFTPHFLGKLDTDPRTCLASLQSAGFDFQDIKEWDRALVPTDIETLIGSYPAADRKAYTNLFLPPRQ